MKLKLFFGLWGCSSEGMLVSSNGRFKFKMPIWIAAKIQSFLHSISYTGMVGTVYIKDILRIKHSY